LIECEMMNNVRVGMIVTDIAHVGKHEVIGVSKDEVKLKLISGKHIGVTPIDGITILPMSFIQMSYLIVENNTSDKTDSDIVSLLATEERIAISLVLAKLSQSKGYVADVERFFLADISRNELRLPLEDYMIQHMADKMRKLDLKDLMKNLHLLNQSQKELVITLGYRMMKAKGFIDKLESVYMNKITKELNISVSSISPILERYGYKQNIDDKLTGYKNSGCFVLVIVSIIISSLFIIV